MTFEVTAQIREIQPIPNRMRFVYEHRKIEFQGRGYIFFLIEGSLTVFL
jgi:hypothetical protein